LISTLEAYNSGTSYKNQHASASVNKSAWSDGGVNKHDFQVASTVRLVDPNLQLEVVETLRDIHEVFEENGIWYSICYGTLLGAVRHQGIIPWDDDADIFVLYSQIDILWSERVKTSFSRRGRQFVKKWYDGMRARVMTRKIKTYPFIDMFYVNFTSTHPSSGPGTGELNRCRVGGGRTKGPLCASFSSPLFWNRPRAYSNEWDERKLYNYSGISVYGPVNADPILTRTYGKYMECKTHHTDHRTSKNITPIKFDCNQFNISVVGIEK